MSKEIIKVLSSSYHIDKLSKCIQKEDLGGDELKESSHLIKFIYLNHALIKDEKGKEIDKKSISIECLTSRDIRDIIKNSKVYDKPRGNKEHYIKLPFINAWVNSRRLDISKQSQFSSFNTFLLWNKSKKSIGSDDTGWMKDQIVYELIPFNRSLITSNLSYDDVFDLINGNYIFIPKLEDFLDPPVFNLETNIYEGEIKDDKKEGWGIMLYKNKKIYEGEWKNNMRNGHGILYNNREVEYEGEWIDDHPKINLERKFKYNITKIACGMEYTLLLLETGQVLGSGSNQDGGIGLSPDIERVDSFTLVPDLDNIDNIYIFQRCSFALKNGELLASGDNREGQLGVGEAPSEIDTAFGFMNILLEGLKVKEMGGNGRSNFIIMENGDVMACGLNNYKNLEGFLMLGEEFKDNYYIRFHKISNLNNVKKIACGNSHALALLETGHIKGWGNNYSHQLGKVSAEIEQKYPDNKVKKIIDISVKNNLPVKDIYCYNNRSILFVEEGKLLDNSAYYWYNEESKELNSGEFEYIPNIENVVSITYGAGDLYFLLHNGQLFYHPEADENDTIVDLELAEADNISLISGYTSNILIYSKEENKLKGQGLNIYGELGIEEDDIHDFTEINYTQNLIKEELSEDVKQAISILTQRRQTEQKEREEKKSNVNEDIVPLQEIQSEEELTGVLQVGVLDYSTIILRNDLKVYYCGGRNIYNNNIPMHSNYFKLYPPLRDKQVLTISCGEDFMFIQTMDNQLMSLGNNEYGQLGLNNTISQDEFMNIDLSHLNIISTEVQTIHCSNSRTFLILDDKSLLGCGLNDVGQLGLGNYETSILLFKRIDVGEHKINEVSTSLLHTLLLTEEGKILGSGVNDQHQLGIENKEEYKNEDGYYIFYKFTSIPSIEEAVDIACGYHSSLILLEDGIIKATGENTFGQLGIGENIIEEFTEIDNINNVAKLYCFGTKTFIIKEDNTVWACGSNDPTIIPNNSNNTIIDFVQIESLNGVNFIEGNKNRVFVNIEEKLYVIGDGFKGELGLGDIETVNSYTRIRDLYI